MSNGEVRRRRWPRDDIRRRPLPRVTLQEWRQDAEGLLDLLRSWADAEGDRAIKWYLRDKVTKRLGSRLLRGLAIVLGVAGGVAPLVLAGRTDAAGANWGYVLLAVAGGCLAFDHFFGLSSGWMRNISTAQALQRRLTEFQLAWTDASAAQAVIADAVDPSVRLELIKNFMLDLDSLVTSETGEWLNDFRANVGQLGNHVGGPRPLEHRGPSTFMANPRSTR